MDNTIFPVMFVKGLAEVKFRISFLINSCIDIEDKFEELFGLVLFDAYALITCEADTRPCLLGRHFFFFSLSFSFSGCCGDLLLNCLQLGGL